MSEEKKIIEYIKKEYGNFDNYVRDLLDLYQKEKEKNKTLETLLHKIREKIKELYETKQYWNTEVVDILKELLEEE